MPALKEGGMSGLRRGEHHYSGRVSCIWPWAVATHKLYLAVGRLMLGPPGRPVTGAV